MGEEEKLNSGRLMDDVLTKIRSETKIARNGGGYYHLQDYKKNGWATCRVKKFCTDKNIHAVLKCMLYKVNSEDGADEAREGEVREQSLKG